MPLTPYQAEGKDCSNDSLCALAVVLTVVFAFVLLRVMAMLVLVCVHVIVRPPHPKGAAAGLVVEVRVCCVSAG
jgi:hypothetical protein